MTDAADQQPKDLAPLAAVLGPSATDAGRLEYIDGLRAVAVLAVLISHAAKYTMDLHHDKLFHAMYEGAHGVDLFFVISGLCLSYPTLWRVHQSGESYFDVARFFARRIVRIIPPYWGAFAIALAAALVMLKLGFQLPWPTLVMPTLVGGIEQLFFLNTGSFWFVGSFWTLGVEFRWYMAFPVLLWLYIRSPLAFFAVGAVSLAVYHLTPFHSIDFATLPGFMLGIVAADWIIRGSAFNRWAPLLAVAVAGASLLLEPGHLRYAYQDQFWWQLACFFLVVAGCTNGVLRRILSLRPLVVVGMASYSIYLVHDPPMGWYGLYGGTSPFLALTLGVLAGFLFFMLWERKFATTPLKPLLVGVLDSALSIIPSRLGIRGGIRFSRSRELERDGGK